MAEEQFEQAGVYGPDNEVAGFECDECGKEEPSPAGFERDGDDLLCLDCYDGS